MAELIKTYDCYGFSREEILKEFDFRDGEFYTTRSRGKRKKGDQCGSITEYGYRKIYMHSKCMFAARVAFFMYNGWLPSNTRQWQIDHQDNDRLNNLESNLRCVTCSQNQWNRSPNKNSTSQYTGVRYAKRDKRWIACIKHEGKYKHIGMYGTEEEAARAYDVFALEARGKFAYLNFPNEIKHPTLLSLGLCYED